MSSVNTEALRRVYAFLRLNVFFASLPLVFAFGIRAMASQPTPLSVFVPELLFLVIMVGVTVMEDIGNQSQRISDRLTMKLIKDLVLASVIVAVALYVLFTYDNLVNPENSSFRDAITWTTVTLSPIICIVSVITEYMLAILAQRKQPNRTQRGGP